MLHLTTFLILITNIYGLLVSRKFIGAEASYRLLKYNNNIKLDDIMVKRFSKGFQADVINRRKKIENVFNKNVDKLKKENIKYDGLTFCPGSIEHDILTYTETYTNELVLHEFENKVHKYKFNSQKHINNNPVIINGKCAFIGFYEDGIFKPYYSFVIKKPDIRHLIVKNIPMKLTLLNEKWLYLENLFNLE